MLRHGKCVEFKDKLIYIKNEDESQKLRMAGGGWSINLDELEGYESASRNEITDIHFETDKRVYKISYEKAKEKGWEMILGQLKEKKLVVPLLAWDIERKSGEPVLKPEQPQQLLDQPPEQLDFFDLVPSSKERAFVENR